MSAIRLIFLFLILTKVCAQSPLDSITVEARQDLFNNVLPYWKAMVDSTYGGFYGAKDKENHVVSQAKKGLVLKARILWTFAHVARRFPVEGKAYHPLADRAYAYFEKNFIDKQHGGAYWMVDFQGVPADRSKQVYGESFAIYALAEYYLLTKNPAALQHAQRIYQLLETHAYDKKHGGYLEAFSESWSPVETRYLVPDRYLATKSMNTHLHVLEAYTHLYRAWKDKGLRKRLEELIELFTDHITAPNKHFHLFFTSDWKVQSNEISFGHDIEGSWLLCEAAEVLGDHARMKKVQLLALDIVNVTIKEGLDKDGGLVYEADPERIINGEKHWWPQAETLVGLINAWQLTGGSQYIPEILASWNFIDKNMIDRESGDWRAAVDRDGTLLLREKAGPWKGPYHHARALVECIYRVEKKK